MQPAHEGSISSLHNDDCELFIKYVIEIMKVQN